MFNVNIHTHQFTTETGQLAVKSMDVKALDEPQLKAELDGSLPQQYFSLGLHPWYLDKATFEDDWASLQRLASHPKVLLLGEAGLDRLVSIDWTFQIQAFQRHVALAEQVQKPLIIHCVRSFPEIIQCKKNVKSSFPWVIHGFNANAVILNQLLDKQFFVSAGAAVFQTKSNIAQLLPTIPIKQLFLETDDKNCTISSIFAQASLMREVDIEFLQEKIFENFQESIFRFQKYSV